MTRENPPFRWLALYYDTVVTSHLGWFEEARRRILGRILPAVGSACDLACGTGTTAVILARRGIRTYGVDISPTMCRQARAKARRERVPLTVLQGDMRTFRLPEQVDLVLCEFDALNHVARKEDMARVARAVARALRSGGHFYFDVNNRRVFETVWPGVWWNETPEVALLMRGGYDRARDRGYTDVDWFVPKGRLWERHREHFEQVAWTAAEMRRYLRAAGFDRIRAFDAAPFYKGGGGIGPGCRTFYLARKAPRPAGIRHAAEPVR